ncbi:MAG: DUF192 domain-containing protein [Thiobacillus sp.]
MQTLTSSLQLTVRRADRFLSRLVGLLFSPLLLPGQGLLIVPCAAVHTAFMRFSIDVVFLDGAGRIQKIVPRLKPWRAAACSGAWQTLELAAGEAQRLELTVGMSLALSLQGFNQEDGA